jgi:hypothetical protein
MEQYREECGARQKGDPEPEQPVARSLTIGSATVEGATMLLRRQPALGIFTAEGGELFGGHSMNAENKMKGLAWYLKAWGAETLDTMTRTGGLTVLIGRRVCMHALMQPVVAEALFSDPLASGQGFLSRCLAAAPQSLAGTRLFKDGNASRDTRVQAYYGSLARLLACPPAVVEGGDGHELQPRRLTLAPQARRLWIAFYNHVEEEQAEGKSLSRARAFASKLGEHAARVAGVLTIAADPNATEVAEPTMAGAIEIATFYMAEHVRLTGASIEHVHTARLKALAEWLKSKGKFVQQKDVLQRAPYALRQLKAEGLRGLLEDLAGRGYIRAAGTGWEVRQ